MPLQSESLNLSVGQFVERHRREMIPLTKPFAYYFGSLPLTEEDIREYLEDPIAALPPAIRALLPKVSIVLVPYLERALSEGRGRTAAEVVRSEKPSENRVSWSSRITSREEAVLVFAMKDQEVADYHYRLYHLLSSLAVEHWSDGARSQYFSLVRDELASEIHGEVDEEGWKQKQGLVRRQVNLRRETKLFRDYAKQSFIDTLTLYLHGICCDIDVDTGPRQLPSRFLRKRLQLLRTLYPPPHGYAVFPEDLTKK